MRTGGSTHRHQWAQDRWDLAVGYPEIDSKVTGGISAAHQWEEQKMTEIKGRLQGMADKEKWAARGASFMAKAKATKVVWFPPEPVDTGKKAAKRATRTTKRAAKTTGGAKKVTSSVRRKKT